MNTLEVLIAARKLIDAPEKWGKEEDVFRSGKCCSLLAISRACESTGFSEEYEQARRSFKLANGIAHSVSVWNDAPERTHAEVMAAFDKAIEHEKEVDK